jgi:hypothetical protein
MKIEKPSENRDSGGIGKRMFLFFFRNVRMFLNGGQMDVKKPR